MDTMRRTLTIRICNQMLALSREGLSQKVIPRRMNLRHEAVNRITRNNARTGILTPCAPPGPSRKTSVHQDKIPFNLARRDRFKSTKELSSDVRKHHTVHVSRQKANRRLVERGYCVSMPNWKPKLNGQHRARLKAWVREHP